MASRVRNFIAATVALWVASTSLATAPALAGSDPETIRFAVVSTYASGAVHLSGAEYVVEKQGWLKEQLAQKGYRLEWYPVANEAFTNHAIQFASYSDLPSIILNAAGADVRTAVVLPGAAPGEGYLVVPANSTAKSIEDLKGKRLAIHKGRPWELTLLHLLDSKGLSYNDFQVYNINLDAGTTAVATGAVDALFAVEPFQIEERGIAKIIWSSKDSPVEWKQWGGIWADKSFLAKHPDIAQLVVTAFVKARYWIAQPENKDEIVQLATVNGTPERIVRRNYDQSPLSWKDLWSPVFSKAFHRHYEQSIQYSLDKGIIASPVNANDLIEDRFVVQALKDLKLENYWGSYDDISSATATQQSAANKQGTTK